MRFYIWERVALIAGVAFVLVVTGCAKGESGRAASPIVVESAQSIPFVSLSDWISYASQVSAFEVESERALDADQSVPERHVSREITIKVERTLWSDGSEAEALSFVTDGWQENDEGRRPLAPSDGPRLEVGERYIGALVNLGGEPAQVGLINSSSVLPLQGDELRSAERSSAAARTLDGITLDELEDRLRQSKPDPFAARFDHLPPVERALHASAAREGRPPPRTTNAG